MKYFVWKDVVDIFIFSIFLGLTGSAAPATLTISPRKVREINDPISQMLNQLHKIIYITQV